MANYWLTIPAVFVVVSLVLLRHYFLHSSRNIQRLEATGDYLIHFDCLDVYIHYSS